MEKVFREQVLDMSLTIEDMLSRILFMHFRISKEKSKTLSHTSSALSFKNKTDLLLDLDRISSETYKYLITFMEIRNQFIHNLSSSNIIISAERVEKLNFLIKFSEEAKEAYKNDFPEPLKITALEISFIKVYEKIIEAIEDFSKKFQKEIDEEIELKTSKELLKTMNDVLKIYTESVDFVSDKFDEVFKDELNEEKKGVFKNAIFSHFIDSINKYQDNKKINDI